MYDIFISVSTFVPCNTDLIMVCRSRFYCCSKYVLFFPMEELLAPLTAGSVMWLALTNEL